MALRVPFSLSCLYFKPVVAIAFAHAFQDVEPEESKKTITPKLFNVGQLVLQPPGIGKESLPACIMEMNCASQRQCNCADSKYEGSHTGQQRTLPDLYVSFHNFKTG